MPEQRRPLRVLHIEDWEPDTQLVAIALRRAGYAVQAHRVETAAELGAALSDATWDAVISDYSLPQFGALQALAILRESGQDLPFVIVSGTIDEVEAVTALRAGAHDFITKTNLARLAPAIEREMRDAADRRERRVAEVRLKTTMDTMQEGAQIIGFDWRYLYVNQAAAAHGHSSTEALVGRTMMEAYPGIEQTAMFAALRRCMEQRVTQRLENEFVYPDGSAGWFSLNIQPVPEGLFVLSRDVTERKRAEAQIQRQLQQLAALRAIDIAISTSLDVRLTLDVFLAQVIEQLGVDAANVLLLEASDQSLAYAAGRGFRSSSFKQARLRLGEGRAGRAALERRIVSETGPIQSQPPSTRTGLLGRDNFVSYFGVPLIAKGQVLGVLELFHRTPLEPDADWLAFMEALAGQAAIAIENASLFSGLQRSHQDLTHAYDATIEGWSRALDLRDKETEGHSQRVTELTLRLAQAFEIGADALAHVRRGALLHDIGKMGIPDYILLKPGPLTDDEWVVMRQHPTFAYELLSPIAFLQPALDIPYCHHEKWDGSGYPRGLAGEQIPMAARLFAVVDVWDALRSDRPYRPAWSTDRVLAHIQSLAGSHFDPRAVDVFLQVVG